MTPLSPHALPASLLDQRIASLPEDDDSDLTGSLLPAHPGAEPVPTSADGREAVFPRPRQVEFLHALAACGVARRASAHVGVSYRTAYRARRACAAFRRAWDAALLSARALSEDVLATRAIDGVEEEVWYHGEVVATRRRYDSRLLLAHLARLDRLTQDARTRAFADDYEGALERFAAGIDDPAPVCGDCGEALPPPVPDPAREGEILPPGQCDKCDTARRAAAAAEAQDAAEDGADVAGGYYPGDGPIAGWDEAWREALPDPIYEDGLHSRRIPPLGYPEWEADMEDPAHWVGGKYLPPLARDIRAMEAARPAGSPPIDGMIGRGEIEAIQLCAFKAGVPDWWLITEDEDLDAALDALDLDEEREEDGAGNG